jgi:hypothetical protein
VIWPQELTAVRARYRPIVGRSPPRKRQDENFIFVARSCKGMPERGRPRHGRAKVTRSIKKSAVGAALAVIATILFKFERSNFTQYLFESIRIFRVLLICFYFKLHEPA